jgi:hypothetical protein
MAMPPMPRPATRPVTLAPRLSRITIAAIANTAMETSSLMMLIALARSVGSPSWSVVLSAIMPRISARAQIATCSAAATTNRNATVLATSCGGCR